ncbi:ANTAR domain-containing protein [Spongisporangium articulatum]|uniref:ANTAR domain-containing protein n=1 Tax=Spongisporangium articulatum TaxID=3362603 RepID=A0ABW8AT85_9ACTN
MAVPVNPDQMARVESLMASVQQLVRTLTTRGAELEQEVALAFYQGDDAGSTGRLQVENERLRRILGDRAVIEQAAGVLMAQRGCSAEHAHEVLMARARVQRRGLHEVARELVDEVAGEDEEPLDEDSGPVTDRDEPVAVDEAVDGDEPTPAAAPRPAPALPEIPRFPEPRATVTFNEIDRLPARTFPTLQDLLTPPEPGAWPQDEDPIWTGPPRDEDGKPLGESAFGGLIDLTADLPGADATVESGTEGKRSPSHFKRFTPKLRPPGR